MGIIKERATVTSRQTISLVMLRWRHTCSTLHTDEIDPFHEHQNVDMQSTKANKGNEKLIFQMLGKLRRRETADDDKQKIDTYRHNTGPCNLPITPHRAKLATTN